MHVLTRLIYFQATERYGNSAGPTELAGEQPSSSSVASSYWCATRRAKKSTTKKGKSSTITIRAPSGHIVCPMLFSDRKRVTYVASLRACQTNERYVWMRCLLCLPIINFRLFFSFFDLFSCFGKQKLIVFGRTGQFDSTEHKYRMIALIINGLNTILIRY